MSDHKDYDSWLEELRVKADIIGVNLNEDKYHYHTYFMRGYSPESVIDDIKNKLASDSPNPERSGDIG